MKKKLKLMNDHALVNVICSGNKIWSDEAMKEWNKRKIKAA